MADKKQDLDETKRLMGALVRMKPKPHEDMKIRKTKQSAPKQKRRKNAEDKG